MRHALTLSALTVGVLAGSAYWIGFNDRAQAQSSPPSITVPVTIDIARRNDVPIYQTGIGTVVAFNTVTVRAQIDGPLEKIAYTEGQLVKSGDLLAQIDARPYQARLAQAEAAKARDVAQLANARLDLVRFQNLKDYATRQSVDTQKTQVSMMEAAIQGDQGQIDDAKVQLGYTAITAPISGRTGIRLVDQGNIVHASDSTGLVVITQLQPISVLFSLPGPILPKLSRAHAAGPLKIEAWSQDDSEKLDDGELTLIDNQMDQSTGTVKLKASFPNKAETLWPGQFVNAHLLLETRRDGITVPAQAIQRGPSGTYVWLVKPDDTVEMRPITLGRIVGDIALLDSGVTAGDRIVTGGQYKLVVGIKTEPHMQEPPQTADLPVAKPAGAVR
ncbi:MAG TPA: efflux RND transporter periplasmic adaptor subunit [Aliidongia sp.]|nr:efflux RND transporter periplasmic adaptor subunit [Aliidongia sp.]